MIKLPTYEKAILFDDDSNIRETIVTFNALYGYSYITIINQKTSYTKSELRMLNVFINNSSKYNYIEKKGSQSLILTDDVEKRFFMCNSFNDIKDHIRNIVIVTKETSLKDIYVNKNDKFMTYIYFLDSISNHDKIDLMKNLKIMDHKYLIINDTTLNNVVYNKDLIENDIAQCYYDII